MTSAVNPPLKLKVLAAKGAYTTGLGITSLLKASQLRSFRPSGLAMDIAYRSSSRNFARVWPQISLVRLRRTKPKAPTGKTVTTPGSGITPPLLKATLPRSFRPLGLVTDIAFRASSRSPAGTFDRVHSCSPPSPICSF